MSIGVKAIVLPSVNSLTRKILSWLVVIAGFLLGLFYLITSGQTWFTTDTNFSSWLNSLFYVAGPGFLGLVFVGGSLAALRHRKVAGFLFIASAPVVAFLLTFPSGAFLVTEPNGSASFRQPPLVTAVILACVFYLPLVAPLFVIRNRRRALYLLAVFAAVALVVLAASHWARAMFPRLAAWSLLFCAVGGFWLATQQRGWPGLRAASTRSPARRIAMILAQCLVILVLDVAGTFAWLIAHASVFDADCSGPSLFVRSQTPEHAVLTARLIRVGHKTNVSNTWAGYWAIGQVEESFWGLSRLTPKLVLLVNNTFREGETYFVSGRRRGGYLTRFLPIVNASPCGYYYSTPIDDAKVHLRVLHNPPPPGFRILGFARGLKPPTFETKPAPSVRAGLSRADWRRLRDHEISEWAFTWSKRYRNLEGVRVSITGSAGTSIVTTDQEGIYDTGPLAPDDYTLKVLDAPANQTALEQQVEKQGMTLTGSWRLDVSTEWDGSIEGHVRDAAGPMQAWLELRNPDGTPTDRGTGAAKDGSFRFDRVPAGGRFLVSMSASGMPNDSPGLFYPSAVRPDDARVLEIQGSSHVKNVDFIATQLRAHDLAVSVGWPNGEAVNSASVHFAYEGMEWDDKPIVSSHYAETDNAGIASLHVYGDWRIRIQAVKLVDLPARFRYSPVMELEATKLPRSLNLMLSSPSP